MAFLLVGRCIYPLKLYTLRPSAGVATPNIAELPDAYDFQTKDRNRNPNIWRNRYSLTTEDIVPAALSHTNSRTFMLKALRATVGSDHVFHTKLYYHVWCQVFTSEQCSGSRTLVSSRPIPSQLF